MDGRSASLWRIAGTARTLIVTVSSCCVTPLCEGREKGIESFCQAKMMCLAAALWPAGWQQRNTELIALPHDFGANRFPTDFGLNQFSRFAQNFLHFFGGNPSHLAVLKSI